MEQGTSWKSDIDDLKGIIDGGILKGGKGIDSRGGKAGPTPEKQDSSMKTGIPDYKSRDDLFQEGPSRCIWWMEKGVRELKMLEREYFSPLVWVE